MAYSGIHMCDSVYFFPYQSTYMFTQHNFNCRRMKPHLCRQKIFNFNKPHFSSSLVGASGVVGGCMTGAVTGAAFGTVTGAALAGAMTGATAGAVTGATTVGGDTTGCVTGAVTGAVGDATGDLAGAATGAGTTLPHGAGEGTFVAGSVVQLRFNLPGVATLGLIHNPLLEHFCSE